MDCRTAQEMLVDLLYGELSPAASEQLQAHLAGCSDCSAEYEQMSKLLELVRANPVQQPSEEVTGRILHAATVAARHRVEKSKSSSGWWKWLIMNPALAGAVVIVLVASVALVTVLPQEKSPEAKVSQQLIAPQVPIASDESSVSKKTSPKDAISTKVTLSPKKESASGRGPSPKALELSSDRDKALVGGSKSLSSGKNKDRTVDDSEQGNLDTVSDTNRSHGRSKFYRARKGKKHSPKRKSAITKTRSDDGLVGSLDASSERNQEKLLDLAGPEVVSRSSAKPSVQEHARSENAPSEDLYLKNTASLASSAKPQADAPKISAAVAGANLRGAGGTDARYKKPEREHEAQAPQAAKTATALDYERDESGEEKPESAPALAGQERASKSNPYLHAKSLFRSGDCKAAISAIDRALKMYPGHRMAADALFDKASCQVKLGRFEQAKETYRRIERDFPKRASEARRQSRRIKP